MIVKLVPVDKDNWRQIVKLEVNEDQNRYVAPNWYSIIEAIMDDWDCSMAIVNEDKEIVGYTMYQVYDKERFGYICRFMIDKRYQGKGYGRAAMKLVMSDLITQPNVDALKISLIPSNEGAKKLYESLGFVDTGEMDDGEMVMAMELKRHHDEGG